MAFSSRMRYLAWATAALVGVSAVFALRVSRRDVQPRGVVAAVTTGITCSPVVCLGGDGTIAASGDDGRVHFLTAGGRDYARTSAAGHFAIAPDGKSALVVDGSGLVHWVATSDATEGLVADVGATPYGFPMFVPRSSEFVVEGADPSKKDTADIVVVDSKNGHVIRAIRTGDLVCAPQSISFNSSGSRMAVGYGGRVVVYDAKSWNRLEEFSGGFSFWGSMVAVTKTAILADGRYLLAGNDALLLLLDMNHPLLRRRALSAYGIVAIGAEGKTDYFWAMDEGGNFLRINAITGKESEDTPDWKYAHGRGSAARSADGRLGVTGGEGGEVTIRQLPAFGGSN